VNSYELHHNKGEVFIVLTEREEYIVDRLIDIHNNPKVPASLKWGAVEIEIAIKNRKPDDEIERLYQKLQSEVSKCMTINF